MSTPLFANIAAQPEALQQVLRFHSGEGLPALQRSAALIRQSSRILLTGMGASLFACQPLRYLLSHYGASVAVVEAAELLYFLDRIADRNTSVVLVSRSGESVEVIRLLDLLAERGCNTIGVANVAGSSLLSRTSAQILLGSPADQLVAIQTYVATVTVLLLLGAASNGDLTQAFGELHSSVEILRAHVPECIQASLQWQSFHSNSALYLLGRGPSLASVEEGVLLMHETAKAPAVGMSAAQFRHGPVEAADGNMRAVVMGTQTATAKLDFQLARDLTHMGADVRWIGPLISASGPMALTPWPGDVPALFQPVFEVIPLQLLAYRAAEARGITPGDFRWAPTITSSEAGFPALQQQIPNP